MVGSINAAWIGLPCYNARSSSAVDAQFSGTAPCPTNQLSSSRVLKEGVASAAFHPEPPDFRRPNQAIFKMFKIFLTAVVVALLTACSGMSDGSMSGMSGTRAMSNSANMGQGSGPVGSSGGGPN